MTPSDGIEHHVNSIASGLPNDRDKVLALVVDWPASQRADQFVFSRGKPDEGDFEVLFEDSKEKCLAFLRKLVS